MDYEIAVDEFMAADKLYSEIEEQFMSGELLNEILIQELSPQNSVQQFKLLLEEMKKLLDDRNAKLSAAKIALRNAVQLNAEQLRGPEGKPTLLSYGPFTVSSVTRRTFDGDALLRLANQYGFDGELTKLTGFGKDGKAFKLFDHAWRINYEGILTWLRERKLDHVISGAYDEAESTPAVKGPKPVAFMGEKKKDE